VKTEKSGGVGECGDDVVGLLVRDRQSLDFCLRKKRSSLQMKCQEKWSVA